MIKPTMRSRSTEWLLNNGRRFASDIRQAASRASAPIII